MLRWESIDKGLGQRNMINDCQHGFTANQSCRETHFLSLTRLLTSSIELGRGTGDLCKTFDFTARCSEHHWSTRSIKDVTNALDHIRWQMDKGCGAQEAIHKGSASLGRASLGHCPKAPSPLEEGWEQEPNLVLLWHPLKDRTLHCPKWAHLCISQSQYLWLFPAKSLLVKPVADTETDGDVNNIVDRTITQSEPHWLRSWVHSATCVTLLNVNKYF